MKRTQSTARNDHLSVIKPKKIKRDDPVIHNFKSLDPDSLSQIFNFLSFKIICKFRLVNRDWKEIIESNSVDLFSPVKNMMKYCEECFVERNDDLFSIIFGWLTGKIRSKYLSLSKPEMFTDPPNPLIVENYPCITVISSTDGWLKEVSYYELMIHIKEDVKIRMFMQLSLREEELVYVNIEKNDDYSFNWNLLNLDPNVKNILVHQVNQVGGNFDERDVKKYCQNTHFFNYLANLFNLEAFLSPLVTILFNTTPKFFINKPTELAKSHQCKQATRSKYSDELRERLVVKPLEKIKEGQTSRLIEIMENVVSNIYSSCLHNEIDDNGEQFRVFNVKGDAYEIPFQFDIHYILATFNMSLNKHLYEGSIHVERGYCGIEDGDIIANSLSFSIIDMKTKSSYKFIGRVEIDSIEWNKHDCERTFQRLEGKNKKGVKSNIPTPSPKTPSSNKSQSTGGSANSKKSSASSTPSLSSKKSISPGVKSASILSFFQPSKSGNSTSSSSTPNKKRSFAEVDSQGNSAEDALIILDDDDENLGEIVNRTPSSSDGGKLFSSAIIDIDSGNDSQIVTIIDNSPVTELVKQDSQQRFGTVVNSSDSQGLNEEDSFDGVRSYYLFHFLEILDTVMRRDGHLFIEEEKEYISNFKNLCTASQRLYIRMFNRKQKYFTKTELDKYKKELEKTLDIHEENSEDLKKDHVICCKSVKEALSHLGSVQLVDSLSIADKEKSSTEWNIDDLKSLLSEFTNKQLKTIIDKKNLSNIVKKEKSKKTTDSPKQDLIKTIITKPEALNSVGSDGKQQKKLTFLKKKEPIIETKPLDDSAKDTDPTIMRPSDILKLIAKASTSNKEIESMYYRLGSFGQTIFKRIHHLYFLSQSADNATIMILEQKKIATFPKYEIQEQKSLFTSREDFIKYEEAFDIANTWMDSIEIPDAKESSNKQNGQDAQNSQDTLLSNIEMRLDMIQKSNVEGIMEKFNNFAKDISSRLDEDTAILKKIYEESNSNFTLDYYLLRFRCGYIYGRLLWFCVKVLERNKNYELAIQYIKQIIESPFMIGKRGEFYNRLALDYEHMKSEESYKNALESCKAAIFNETDSLFARSISLPPNKLYALEKRYFRICKKLEKINSKQYSSLSKDSSVVDKFISTNIKPPKLVYIQGKTKKLQNRKYREKKHHFISHKDNETIVNVEEFAMEHYEMKNCMQGAHSEGSLWAMMFMLVMWNIVFDSSVPYVFQNKYQSCPLDFMTDAFYIRRKDKFKKRLEEIEEKGAQYLKEQIKTCWNENYGVNAACCNWRSLTESKEEDEEMTMEIPDTEELLDNQNENKENDKLEALVAIAECFPIKVITTILQTLAEDIKENRSGMPDLILWKIQQDGKHDHLLSEIKGPGDKLSEKQIIWIDLLTKAGCSIEVCHVKVKEDSSTSSTPTEQQPKKKRKCSSDSQQIEFLDDDLWASIEEQPQAQEDNEDSSSSEDDSDEIDLLEP